MNAASAEGVFVKSSPEKVDEKLPGITNLFEIGQKYRALYVKN
jgi:hypothetical protein